MQVLFPCLLFLVLENVKLAQNERLDAHGFLNSTQFKNAVAKELLKKKLPNLAAAARQQDSIELFLKKSKKNLSGLKTAPKSSFHKDDDPSQKQAQMAKTIIASSNLLFGAKSQQKKACHTGKHNKEVLDMQSLRQARSGYSEEGSDLSPSKQAQKLVLVTLNDSDSVSLQKRSNPKKNVRDPISCYMSEPKKVTCVHKDIIYKISLPTSEVADDEIGRIVESIYQAVEGKSSRKESMDESIAIVEKGSLKDSADATSGKNTPAEDSSKKKRASEDYLQSFLLNSLLGTNQTALPNYNSNSPVLIPLLIPMVQPKLDPLNPPAGFYSAFAVNPGIQIPMNKSVGTDPVKNYLTGRNAMFNNGYGQYLVPEGFALPELNLKQRSQVNQTAEEEKRRNWLALMATNGLVPLENGMDPKMLAHHTLNGDVQSIGEETGSHGGYKLTVAETSEVLNKLFNERHQRDTYYLKRQLKRKPIIEVERPTLKQFVGDGRKHVLTKVVQKLSDPGEFILEEKKGCPCPCPSDMCATSRGPKKPITCSPAYPENKQDLLFPPPTIQSNNANCCSTATKCSPCLPTLSSPCDVTSSKPCSSISDKCEDVEIISRVISGGTNQKLGHHPNWLPHSPHFVMQDQPQHVGQSHQFFQHYMTPTEQDNQQSYYESRNRGSDLQPSINSKYSDQLIIDDQHSPIVRTNEQFGRLGLAQNKYSESTELQGQFLGQTSSAINQIQVKHQIHDYPQPFESKINQLGDELNELQNRSISQTPINNVPFTQSQAVSKKHKDSFFARLRSKFHMGVFLNGTDLNQDSNRNQQIQNKAILGTSVFKFSLRNQTLSSGKDESSTLNPPNNNQQYMCNQNNQLNDQTPTSNNQTQPATVNKINITIQSMESGAQGQLQMNNRTYQPAPSSCTSPASTTSRAENGQNGRTCELTKIWLCPRSTNTIACTQSSMSQTPCQTTPTACASSLPTTCITTTSSTTHQSSYPPSGYRGMTNPNQYSGNSLMPEKRKPPGGLPTKSESPEPKIVPSINYGPYPQWKHWQHPTDRNNVHSPEQNLNWQQQTRVPLPTPYVPQLPQRQFHDPKVPYPTPPLTTAPQSAHQKPPEHHASFQAPIYHEAPYQNQRIGQKLHRLIWQQSPNQRLEPDPRWQDNKPKLVPPSSGAGQPIRNKFQYSEQTYPKWSEYDKSMTNETGARKANLPSDINQHIARVRRYLLKKRSKMSKQLLAMIP